MVNMLSNNIQVILASERIHANNDILVNIRENTETLSLRYKKNVFITYIQIDYKGTKNMGLTPSLFWTSLKNSFHNAAPKVWLFKVDIYCWRSPVQSSRFQINVRIKSLKVSTVGFTEDYYVGEGIWFGIITRK